MKKFKNVAIIISKIIIVLLIIIPNVLIIHSIIDRSISKEYIYETTLKYPIDFIRTFNSQFVPYEGDKLSSSDARGIISAVYSNNSTGDEKVELIKAYKSLSKQETYKVQLEYSKDTCLVCRVIISPSSSSEDFTNQKEEETFTTEELNDFLESRKFETKITLEYEDLIKLILQYLPFLFCYILLLVNIIMTKKSKNVTDKSKEIWLYITLIAIISIFHFCLFDLGLWGHIEEDVKNQLIINSCCIYYNECLLPLT